MTHDVRDMCHDCGAWFWVSDGHSCPPSNLYLDAAMVAAFPSHPLVDEAAGNGLDAAVLADRKNRLAVEAFDLDVERVMWEQHVGRRTAVHVVEAERRLDARKAELRAARAAA